MNNLEAVVKRAKRDIELKYVYVMMPIPQLETLLAGLEEAQKRVEDLETLILKAKDDIHAGVAGFALHDINRYFKNKEESHG